MTMLFSNSSPKVLKSGILGPKLRHFCFFVNFRKQTKLRVLISNMTIVFLKFLPKNTQGRHFLSQIQAFSLFQDILQLDKFEGADFKFDNIFFQIPAQKYPNHTFLVQNLDFFFLRKICNQTNLRVLISNMTIVFSNLQPKNTKIRHFWPDI